MSDGIQGYRWVTGESQIHHRGVTYEPHMGHKMYYRRITYGSRVGLQVGHTLLHTGLGRVTDESQGALRMGLR